MSTNIPIIQTLWAPFYESVGNNNEIFGRHRRCSHPRVSSTNIDNRFNRANTRCVPSYFLPKYVIITIHFRCINVENSDTEERSKEFQMSLNIHDTQQHLLGLVYLYLDANRWLSAPSLYYFDLINFFVWFVRKCCS